MAAVPFASNCAMPTVCAEAGRLRSMKLTVPEGTGALELSVTMARSVTAVPRATVVIGAVVPSVSTLNAVEVCAIAETPPGRIVAASRIAAPNRRRRRAKAAEFLADPVRRDSMVTPQYLCTHAARGADA